MRDICEQWVQKLVLKVSAIIDNAMEEEQVLLDKTEVNLNVHLKMTAYKKDVEKDEMLAIQMKPVNVW